MKLLLDMNLPRDLAPQLQQAGYECRRAADIGLAEAEDSEIIDAARRAGETILTHDLDYGELLAFSGTSHPSAVIFRMRDVSVDNLARQFLMALPRIETALREGAIVVIGDDAARVRRLPV